MTTILTTDNANYRGPTFKTCSRQLMTLTLSEYFMTRRHSAVSKDYFTTLTTDIKMTRIIAGKCDVPSETNSTRSKEPSDLVGWRWLTNHA
jgi:hypothetical protein